LISKKQILKKPNKLRLTAHFTLAQLIHSKTATKKGIDNTPPKKIIRNLKQLARGLEEVRSLLGYPLAISSGYRCKALNSAVGGGETSQHMQGLAVDFVCKQAGTPYRICKMIADSDLGFDQLIHEYGKSKKEQWIHLGFGPKNRRHILTICASRNFRRDGLHRLQSIEPKLAGSAHVINE
jgi:zinc D-Ala-D-Ala carboxypeptidase